MIYRKYIYLTIALTVAATPPEREDKHLDTTPQEIHNPNTTLYITPACVKDHLNGYQPVAQDLQDISQRHRYTVMQRHRFLLQNLGNEGTAAKPILYTMPERIGATSGFYVHDWYFRNPCQLRYYDTKSPYTQLNVALSQLTYLNTDVCFSRNVNPYWNLGCCFQYLDINRRSIPFDDTDRDALLQGIDLFTHIKTPGAWYQLFLHCLGAKHQEFQAGGVINRPGKDGLPYLFEDVKTPLNKGILHEKRLENRLDYPPAESTEVRKQLYGYQQLALLPTLWGYHELSTGKREYRFEKQKLSERSRKRLGGIESDPEEQIKDRAIMWNTENECGLKGEWKHFFGRGYYRHRHICFDQAQWEGTKDDGEYRDYNQNAIHEHYVGGRARYLLMDPDHTLHAQGEYLLEGFYKAQVGYEGPLFSLTGQHIKHKPPFVAQRYQSYHRVWQHQLEAPTATSLSGHTQLHMATATLRPHIRITRVQKPIYFKDTTTPKDPTKKTDEWEIRWAKRLQMIAQPHQSTEHADVLVVGAEIKLTLGEHVRWDSDITFARVSGPAAEVLQVPTLCISSRAYYVQQATTGDGVAEVGLDMRYKSTYMADAYDPVTRQFYLQDDFAVRGYPILDAFCNYRIKSFCGFVKMSYLNQYLLFPGYFVTPYYPGPNRSLDIGVQWTLFN